MPVFQLTCAVRFPPPQYAEPDGLLAVGGDLSPERLLLAYRMGIFPWYGKGLPILWWSPDPRLVLFPDELRISRSLRRVVAKGTFRVTVDRSFARVIAACARAPRRHDGGTWIVPEMEAAYGRLHDLGYAHSVETWLEDELVGGLYGVALGGVFFGESMFALRADASKVALVHLVERLRRQNFELIDCQVTTRHLRSLGAREIRRELFLEKLAEALETPFTPGSWAA